MNETIQMSGRRPGASAAGPSHSSPEMRVRQRLNGRAIVLVGLMGAGKSTVGRRLASRLGLAFRDADDEIEAAAGMTIPDIFAVHGEGYFRDGERRVIARVLQEAPIVLATGGGAFMDPQTREAIKAAGLSVWLKADLDTLMRRVRKRANRPLLQNPDPEGTMRKLMEIRYPVYSQADVTAESRDGSHEHVVSAILSAIDAALARELPS